MENSVLLRRPEKRRGGQHDQGGGGWKRWRGRLLPVSELGTGSGQNPIWKEAGNRGTRGREHNGPKLVRHTVTEGGTLRLAKCKPMFLRAIKNDKEKWGETEETRKHPTEDHAKVGCKPGAKRRRQTNYPRDCK